MVDNNLTLNQRPGGLDLLEDDLQVLSRYLGEDKSTRAARLKARQNYQAAEMPDRVNQLWRFSDPTWFLPADTDPAQLLPGSPYRSELPTATEAPQPIPLAAATIDLWPGLAPFIQVAAGVQEGTLAAAVLTSGIRSAGQVLSPVFGSLNEAAWNSGLRLQIAPDAVLPGPIYLRVHARVPSFLPRIVIDVGAGAKATIVEEHTGGGPGVNVVGVTEVIAGASSQVQHVLIQVWEPGTTGHLSYQAAVDRDADLLTVFGTFGGDRVKLELSADLVGAGARSEMMGIALGGDKQRFDHHTRHRHLSDHTWSNIDFKAVTSGRSRSSYSGLIRIEEQAQFSEAYQENRNLLLSKQSRVDAVPELEIHNQEVSCSHGTTVAPVDQEQLFYLQSKGLDPAQAMALIVRGFLARTFDKLPGAMPSVVESWVDERLDQIRREWA